MINTDKVLILDFGSQYTQLIARKIRELNVYSEIHPFNLSFDKIKEFGAKAIILSGGPNSVYEDGAPDVSNEIFNLNVPVLGICYGMQLIAHKLNGAVKGGNKKEYGQHKMEILKESILFENLNDKTVLMSHGDSVSKLPDGFEVIAQSDNTPYCAIENIERQIWGIQFHPEVNHTPCGIEILKNFLFKIAKIEANWNMDNFIKIKIDEIRNTVKDDKVILGLSGGVDSSVAAVLIHKAIGKNLKCIFVNNGVLRLNEGEKVQKLFRDAYDIDLIYVDASEIFLEKLKNVTDPEQKRKIIGHTFVEIFDEEAKKIEGAKFLAQGTLYPDVIESVSFKGPSDVIKSHHNVGGLPEKMNLKLLEPFRELFKDEVRILGKKLDMPDSIVYRQPFPGPGLAVRILGDITKEKVDVLQKADDIVVEEIKKAGLYNKLWQAFAVLLPIKTVGVMGDQRTYENVCAIRAVESTDAMTANWAKIPYEVLDKISSRIINEVRGINRVVYDISSKPPSTIEWE
ncbi:MAG: glutamine-hydrolyzing GMP synthase [Cyanobacteria bacterium SIG30]|nr:glutamine-hydrolyzing GMP synthase [Cyanobacteria bacterium SIG30]